MMSGEVPPQAPPAVPQWKRELIARLQSRRQMMVAEVQQPAVAIGSRRPTCPVAEPVPVAVRTRNGTDVDVGCGEASSTAKNMVMERMWEWDALGGGPHQHHHHHRNGGVGVTSPIMSPCSKGGSDSDSSEDLHYGPGIVNKLRNKYLSLALRESTARASILPLRKAASLENVLDEPPPLPRAYQPLAANKPAGTGGGNKLPARYRSANRHQPDMKRARSVEAISTRAHRDAGGDDVDDEDVVVRPKRESLHEEMLITNGSRENGRSNAVINNKATTDAAKPCPAYTQRVNRPKRLQPLMNDKEKPPADVVRQARLIFEKRPEQRTRAPHHTGEVAAKVASYKNIIQVQAKPCNKPPLKVKPKPRKELQQAAVVCKPDVSRTTNGVKAQQQQQHPPSLQLLSSDTPDLILTSSPKAAIQSPTFRISATENFIREEVIFSSGIGCANNVKNHQNVSVAVESPPPPPKVPTTQPLRLEILSNGEGVPQKQQQQSPSPSPRSPLKSPPTKTPRSPPPPPPPASSIVVNNKTTSKPNLTILEIEKNLINTAKSMEPPALPPRNGGILLESPTVPIVAAVAVAPPTINDEVIIAATAAATPSLPKVPRARKPEPENNCMVFNFTDRKDVPDYVHNDGMRRTAAKVEKPPVGEGGITLLPGATFDESCTDEDEEILRSLEAPPSPCDVTFINDNVLIEGKSSLSQKTKKPKMRISFVEAGPEVFIYPSESSMLIEETPPPPAATSPISNNAQMGHTVPSLTGSSSLATYTPKATTEDFQPGVTRSNIPSPPAAAKSDDPSSVTAAAETDGTAAPAALAEVDSPVTFSAGTNSDILF